MRVVAGSAGGLRLEVPRTGVRPTMDRVKAAMFSSLAPRLAGARVLDLFAGSGALGIEALSRGAASVVFVENQRTAVAAIKRNLEHTGFTAVVHTLDVFHYLERVAPSGAFDLVFADPPYAKAPGERDYGSDLVACPALQRCLADGGLFVLEQLPGTGPRPDTSWECVRLKRYGATEVVFLVPRQKEVL